MSESGLRELRQNASDLVRRAEAGESITITVSGRPAAVLGPYRRRTWHTFDEIADVLATPKDPGWRAESGTADDYPRDPWDSE